MRSVGIILAGGSSTRMRELSNLRAIAAMPIAGSYRSIDFTLSNMTNSGIGKVAVITQFNARSLNLHLMSSKWWNFGRKKGGLYLFTPTITNGNNSWYRGTMDGILQNISWLRRCHEPYVVIAPGDGIYKLDYNKVIDYHISKNADVTVVCTTVNEDPSRFGLVKTSSDNRIVSFQEKPKNPEGNHISCGVYVFRRRTLIDLIEKCALEDRYDLVYDIIISQIEDLKIYAYDLETYWSSISSVEDYYKTNMDFLKKEVRDFFFRKGAPVYTKPTDFPPAKYNYKSRVRNSIIATGCIVNGTVENSILFNDVYVGENTVIKNSIVLNENYIGNNVVLENCIVESHGGIADGNSYTANDEVRIVAERVNKYGL